MKKIYCLWSFLGLLTLQLGWAQTNITGTVLDEQGYHSLELLLLLMEPPGESQQTLMEFFHTSESGRGSGNYLCKICGSTNNNWIF